MPKKILKYLLYAAIFTPLIKFSNTVFPFIFAKAVFFQILVSIAFVFYIYLLFKGEIGWPKQSKIFWVAIIFLGVITIVSLFGVDFAHSFWDAPERMTGIFNLLYYVAFLVMLVSVFETKTEGRQLALALWVMGILLMLSGYVQLWDYNFWGYEARSRIAGLLNNPIFYAMAMVWQVFLSLFLATEAPNKKKKIIYIVGALTAFYAIFLSQTRGSVIGATAGLIIFGLGEVFVLKEKNIKIKIKILAIIGVACLSIFILWANRDTAFVKKLPISYYLNISPFANTGATRLFAWKAAYSGWLERPIFGWGLNNFNIIFNKFYNPETLRYTAYETWFDRAHNVTLEFLSTTGVVGLAAYLALFAVAFWIMIKAVRRGEAPRQFLFLGAGLAAYFIQNQFALDQPTSLLLFFSFLALINIYGEPKEKLVVTTDKRSNTIPVIVAILAIFSVYKFNIIPLYAGYLDVSGVGTESINYNFSKDQFKKALAIEHPYRFDSVIEFTQVAIKASIAGKLTNETRAADFQLAEQEMKNLIGMHPLNTYYHYLLGRLYSEWGRYDQKYFAIGEIAFQSASTLSPRRQQIFFGLGQLYLFSGETDKAKKAIQHIIDLEPRVGEAHWYMALVYNSFGEDKKTMNELEEASRFSYTPQTADELKLFYDLFAGHHRYRELGAIYERYLHEKTPNDGQGWFMVARIWVTAEDYELAGKAAREAKRVDPTLASQVDELLQALAQVEQNKLK